MTSNPTAPHAARDADDAAALIALAREICARADEPWPLADMAARFDLSPSAFQRRFASLVGLSPKALQDAARPGRLKAALRAGSRVTDAILDAGFGSTSRVYGEAQRDLGMTPSAYRDGAPGEVNHWAVRTTALGPLMPELSESAAPEMRHLLITRPAHEVLLHPLAPLSANLVMQTQFPAPMGNLLARAIERAGEAEALPAIFALVGAGALVRSQD